MDIVKSHSSEHHASSDFLLETKLINEEEYTSLTTEVDKLGDFCKMITGSEDAFETFCKVLMKRGQKVTSCEYLSPFEALYILDNAIVERSVSMNNFCDACSLVESELNDTSSGIASVASQMLRGVEKRVKGVISLVRGVAKDRRSAVDAMKEKIKLNKIEEIQKALRDTEFKISTEMEIVEKLFKTTLNTDQESAVGKNGFLAVESAHSVAAGRFGTTAAAVSAAVLGPFSLVCDIASLSEAARNKRKGDKTDAEEMHQSMRDIVEMKCKIFNNILRGDFEDEERMFESLSC